MNFIDYTRFDIFNTTQSVVFSNLCIVAITPYRVKCYPPGFHRSAMFCTCCPPLVNHPSRWTDRSIYPHHTVIIIRFVTQKYRQYLTFVLVFISVVRQIHMYFWFIELRLIFKKIFTLILSPSCSFMEFFLWSVLWAVLSPFVLSAGCLLHSIRLCYLHSVVQVYSLQYSYTHYSMAVLITVQV